jgi:vacuolar-type H+-ATPase subunit H
MGDEPNPVEIFALHLALLIKVADAPGYEALERLSETSGNKTLKHTTLHDHLSGKKKPTKKPLPWKVVAELLDMCGIYVKESGRDAKGLGSIEAWQSLYHNARYGHAVFDSPIALAQFGLPADHVERVWRERAAVDNTSPSEVDQAGAQLAILRRELKEAEDERRQILVAAREEADRILTTAREDADRIYAAARREADRILLLARTEDAAHGSDDAEEAVVPARVQHVEAPAAPSLGDGDLHIFRLQDVGHESFGHAEIIAWYTDVGEFLVAGDIVATLLIDGKFLIDLPASFSGQVTRLIAAARVPLRRNDPICEHT